MSQDSNPKYCEFCQQPGATLESYRRRIAELEAQAASQAKLIAGYIDRQIDDQQRIAHLEADKHALKMSDQLNRDEARYWGLQFAECKQQRAALLKDKERLAFILKTRLVVGEDPSGHFRRFIIGNPLTPWPDSVVADGDTPEEAIDAAMKAGKETA